MLSAMTNYFQSNCDLSNNYVSLQKKDDDFYVRMIESWQAKYQVGNVDTDKKVELMVKEIGEIPLDTLTITDINNIKGIFHGVASKTGHYKQMLIDLLRKNSDSRIWLDEVYIAFPLRP